MSETKYSYGKAATAKQVQAAAKAIGKQESKPSVTAVAREYMGKGYDDESVLSILKAAKIKHGKDLKGMGALRRSLARAGDIDIGGTKPKKSSANSTKKGGAKKSKAPAKRTSSKKKAAAKKSKPKKEKVKTTTAKEDDDPLA